MIGHPGSIERSLAKLIATRSLSGQEAQVQEHVRKLMVEAGADSVRTIPVEASVLRERYAFETPTPTDAMFAVVGAWGGPAVGPFVLLNGHVDTVPAGEGWAVDPSSRALWTGG